jgi:penicillin-binding protein activator
MKTNWMMLAGVAGIVAAGSVGGLGGCAGSGGDWNVKRVDPSATTDVDYRFNDSDSRQVFQAAVGDALSRPWIDTWMREHGGERPIIFLGTVRNDTDEYIDTKLFTTQIEEELINSGRVRVKTAKDLRPELRDERLDTRYNDPATIKAVAKELNADLALVGRVGANKQRTENGRTVVSYYQVNMDLTNVETAEVLWRNTSEIKKVAKR